MSKGQFFPFKRSHLSLFGHGSSAIGVSTPSDPTLLVVVFAGCLIFGIVILLTGCTSPQMTPETSTTTTSLPSPTPVPTLNPQNSPTAPSTGAVVASPTATSPGFQCGETNGTILQDELQEPSLPRSLPYRIYLPPCFEQMKTSGLPTLYLLHGLYLTNSQWDDLGADEIATDLILEGILPPFLIVMPWERTGLDLELAITQGLIQHIERNYHAIPDRRYRAIGGISRGGGWALRIGLKNPETFGAIGLHSPAILPPDLLYLPRWIEALAEGAIPNLWIDMGERDTLRFELFSFAEELDRLGMRYTWSMAAGEHTADYWSRRMEVYLRWYADPWLKLNLTP